MNEIGKKEGKNILSRNVFFYSAFFSFSLCISNEIEHWFLVSLLLPKTLFLRSRNFYLQPTYDLLSNGSFSSFKNFINLFFSFKRKPFSINVLNQSKWMRK